MYFDLTRELWPWAVASYLHDERSVKLIVDHRDNDWPFFRDVRLIFVDEGDPPNFI